jgi:hypothetical protein
LTRVGGAGTDVVVSGAPPGELHFWDEPPKVVFVGAAGRPRVNGVEVVEVLLEAGDRIEWGGVRLRYQARSAPVLIEEPSTPPPSPVQAAVAAPPSAPVTSPVFAPVPDQAPPAAPAAGIAERAWWRVQAGMAVDLGMADRRSAARWQEAVVRREFDADACARDLLGAGGVRADDPRLLDRAGRLLRDFLMSSATSGIRGAGRRARKQVRSGAAMVVAQGVTIGIYTGLLLVIMILCRIKWGWSYDQLFDRVTGR